MSWAWSPNSWSSRKPAASTSSTPITRCPHAASAYLAKQILNSERLKTFTTLHGTDITLVGADPSFQRVVKFAIEKSDGVTAVSRYLMKRTVEEFDIRREIRVIPNFVEIAAALGESRPVLAGRRWRRGARRS